MIKKLLIASLLLLFSVTAHARGGVGCDSNTQLLLHMNGADTSTTFTDENCDGSGAHTVTANGDAQQDSGVTKFGNTGLFDGTGDYLSIPGSDDFNILDSLATDVTVDFHVRHASDGAEVYYVVYNGTGGYIYFRRNSNNKIRFQTTATDTNIAFEDSATITGTSWRHLAFIKDGRFLGLYNNGNQVAYGWLQSTGPITSATLYNGAWTDGSNSLNGNVDELRFQDDNYFSASPNSFPAAPLLAYCEGTDEDTSMTNEGYGDSITFNGTAKLDNGQKKLNATTSLLLDGNSDYLSISDTSGTGYDIVGSSADSWTIDLWVYVASLSAYNTMVNQSDSTPSSNERWSFYITSTSGNLVFAGVSGGAVFVQPSGANAITANNWIHVSLVKHGIHYGTYANGIQVGYDSSATTDTYTGPLYVGHEITGITGDYFDGYMEQIQITKGNKFGLSPIEEPYAHYKMNDDAANTTVTDDGSGANNGTASTNTSNLSVVGKVNDAFEFNGSTENVNVNALATDINADTTGSFSFWVYPTGAGGTLYSSSDGTNTDWFIIYLDGSRNPIISLNDGANWWQATITNPIPQNTWTHMVVTQDGTADGTDLYINGVKQALSYSESVLDGSEWFSQLTSATTGRIAVRQRASADLYWVGNIDDFRYYQNITLTEVQVWTLYNSGSGTEEWSEFNVPTSTVVQDTITVPTAEYGTSKRTVIVN